MANALFYFIELAVSQLTTTRNKSNASSEALQYRARPVCHYPLPQEKTLP